MPNPTDDAKEIRRTHQEGGGVRSSQPKAVKREKGKCRGRTKEERKTPLKHCNSPADLALTPDLDINLVCAVLTLAVLNRHAPHGYDCHTGDFVVVLAGKHKTKVGYMEENGDNADLYEDKARTRRVASVHRLHVMRIRQGYACATGDYVRVTQGKFKDREGFMKSNGSNVKLYTDPEFNDKIGQPSRKFVHIWAPVAKMMPKTCRSVVDGPDCQDGELVTVRDADLLGQKAFGRPDHRGQNMYLFEDRSCKKYIGRVDHQAVRGSVVWNSRPQNAKFKRWVEFQVKHGGTGLTRAEMHRKFQQEEAQLRL